MKATQKWTKPDSLAASTSVLYDVEKAFNKIVAKYPLHPSLQHSAYVVQEEFNEVLQEMKAKDGSWNYTDLYNELIDLIVAAMRMICDCPDLAAQSTPYWKN